MIVVSDTSPLNYLVLTGLDHLLPALFGRIYYSRGGEQRMALLGRAGCASKVARLASSMA